MSIDRILDELAAAGIYLAVQDGKLLCKVSAGSLSPQRRQLIADRKAEFIAYLQEATPASAASEPPLVAHAAGPSPLSPTQQRLWFIDQLTDAGAGYTVPVTYRLRGPLDVAALVRGLQRVVARHDSLHSVIRVDGGEPVAVVRPELVLDVPVTVLDAADAAALDAQIRAQLQDTLARAFDLTRELPLRAALLRVAEDDHVLLLSAHHIASDGWSTENLLRELSALYAAFRDGRPDPLPPLALHYADYARWQRQWLQGERLQRQLGYWRTRLAGLPVVHGVPLDHPRPPYAIHAGGSWRQHLSGDVQRALTELGRRHGATLFMTLQAAFAVLIARWSGENDIAIGTPVANRPRDELAPLIGFFANTLVLRTQMHGDPTFLDVLRQTRANALDAYEFQHLPFEILVEDLNPPRSLNLAPLFQIMFSLADIDEDAALHLPGIAAEAITPDLCKAKFDLNLSLLQTGDGLDACWDYSRELFETDTVARLGAAFAALLDGIVADPAQRIGDLPLLDHAQREHVLALSRGEDHAADDEHCLHELIERQAERRPDAIALTHDGGSLAYATLDRAANRLAHHLRTLGVGPDVPVAIVAQRGPALLTGLLAILKAGGAYVPMEADAPAQRLRYLIDDCAPAVILSHGDTTAQLRELCAASGAAARVLDLETDAALWADASTPYLRARDIGLTPANLAYIIYTSGSTGQPKGVMVEHRSIVNRLLWMQRAYPHAGTDAVLQKTPIGFDVSVREIFLTLLAGARLVAARPDGHKDPAYLVDLIRRERIGIVGFVPSMLQVFLEHPRARDCASIRRIFCGGETLSAALVRQCRERFPEAALHNLYGPTETAVSVTAWDCPRDAVPDVIPLGTPGANVRIYLLDTHGRLVPRGMRGEIHIAGRQVARGYLERAALSAERFVADPFHDGPDARMYRSGDLGRQLPGGEIEYLGRNDFQVKIRGQRIEPGEIEAQLLASGAIRQAAVVARDDGNGDARLVAYVVAGTADTDDAVLVDTLRRHAQMHLPPHLLPAAYVVLAQLPVTTNGKLDAKALPAPDHAASATAPHLAPQSELEQTLVALWQELLRREGIGVGANFFELGGHSLLLTRLQNRIGARYGVELALKDLFTAQTVRDQAALIETQRQEHAVAPLLPQPRPADAAPVLSYAQQRLWFIDQMGEAGAVYNIPCALRLGGPLHVDSLRQALQAIVERHAVLRTAIVAVDGEAQPRVRDGVRVTLACEDLGALGDEIRNEVLRQRLDAEAARAFDLAADLLLRAQLLRLGHDDHMLLLTLHHIAADGWSMAVLLRELAQLYDAARAGRDAALPALSLHYADYAHWQREWLQGERLDRQLEYWQRQLATLPVVHSLPLDFPRPQTQQYRGAMYWQHLPRSLLDGVKQLARAHDATLFMTVQAAFAVLLARWSGETDIVVGTPIANRRHEALTPLIGLFVNTLVLRSDLSGNPRFDEVLAAAKAIALDAYQHQDLPFEMLVDRLRPPRSLSHSPLFQVMIALDNNDSAIVPFGGLSVVDAAGDSQHAKFDLTLNLRETPRGFDACWDYNRDLFRADTVARIAASFDALLGAIVATPQCTIQQLPLRDTAAPADYGIGATRALPDVAGVHALFEAVAAAQPDAAAVDDGRQRLSYAALNARANRLAHALIAHGVAPDTRVAIHAAHDADVLVATLAVLKAGGAFVPLDPAHPPERLAAMLHDSGAGVLLTQRALRHALPANDMPVLLLDDAAAWSDASAENPQVAALRAHHLAYVIYTSGSTGTPKGVMVEHASLLNMVEDSRHRFGDAGAIHAAWWGSAGFDVSVFELLVPMALGGTLHVMDEDIRADADALLHWYAQRRITHAYLPPFLVRHLRDCAASRIAALSLRRVMTGAEAPQEDTLHRVRRLLPDLVIVNAYGPTEATVYCTSYTDIRDLARAAPIGRPADNMQVHVLDDALQPVPAGVVGEIHIGGRGLARGYLGRASLTAGRFVHDDAGTRLYKTGDLGRWLADGQLEFRGRRDLQFKINGVRIEPGEIEALLRTHAQVRDAVVVARATGAADERQLVAYVVARDGEPVAAEALRDFLAPHLPPYMLPAAYVALDALPLNVSGKLDAKALPPPDMSAYTSAAYEAPHSELEHRLAALWQTLLQHERISVGANFFDLGGHSLNAVRLMSSIRELTGRALPISILFKAPTIRALAAQIEAGDEARDESFVVLREPGSQAPLFVFHAAGGDVLCYQPLLQYLDRDVPVCGFHRSELPRQRVPRFASVEQLADDYVERMLGQQPEGAFHLAGWSSGGLLALEIAVRLRSRGRDVAVVALIDTLLATGTDVAPEHHAAGLDALQRLSDRAACDLMRAFEPGLPEVTPQNGVLDISATDYFNYLVAANQIGLDFHKPDFQLDARVHYFACGRNTNLKSVDARVAEIQALVVEPIVVETFDATHFSIMEEPHVAQLGPAMDALLRRCRLPVRRDTVAPTDRGGLRSEIP